MGSNFYLIGWIVLMLVILVILALIGLGWDTFFGGVKKGVEKIGNLPEVKNLTNKAKNEFGSIIGNSNSTLDIVLVIKIIWNPEFSKEITLWKGVASPVFGIPSIFVRAWTFGERSQKPQSFSYLVVVQQNINMIY